MKTFINELGSTNFRIFVTTMTFHVTVLVLLAGMMLDKNLDKYEWVIGSIFMAEALFAGLDVTQFGWKRKTDAEYVKAQQGPPVNVEKAQTVEAQGYVTVAASGAVTGKPVAARASRVLTPDD